MILDNKNTEKKVYEWLNEYTESGDMDIVTGYFTVGALSYLSRQINDKVSSFRMVLGDIVNVDLIHDRSIDLLNENITIEAALKLSSVAQEAVHFLKQEKVEAKTLEPNFCHAKIYLFDPETDERHKYFISGSSNLTEAGIGLKSTNNVELNIAETGNSNQYQELVKWFNDLWKSKEAHKSKTIIHENGKRTTTPFKKYLIEAIEQIFIKYTPEQLYYKVLYELFGSQLLSDQDNPDFNRQVGRLENTVIYNTLYDFQQKGVLSLIKMLQKNDGAILADAVGLGKTWSALAVMKFFQLQGREVILVCPKKLLHNWHRYLRHQNSRFEKDKLDYFIRFHTDMHSDRMVRYNDRADKLFRDEKPKLFVIDESHNLRNGKSQRYRFLVDEILSKNADVKILMLSATPINNTLIDIRNQFKLMRKGMVDGFFESHSIRNIDHLFNRAQHAFREWRESDSPRINEFIKLLPRDFFRLTDSLTVARTRQMIEKQNTDLFFPKKTKPENIFVTPTQIGNYESFEELFNHFPPTLSAYQPALYVEQTGDIDKIHDERQRDHFLVKMMYILLVKRLESSWCSFHSTVNKILEHHQNTLDKLKSFEKAQQEGELDVPEFDFIGDDEEENFEPDFSLGKKRPISLGDIQQSGNFDQFKLDIKLDIEALEALRNNLDKFRDDIKRENRKPHNLKSKDEKLESLIGKINKKRLAGKNDNNQKVLIFTVYKDTALYLFDQLVQRGFKDVAMVSGDISKTDSSEHVTKNFEPILERFAPYTKLYMEKEWESLPDSVEMSQECKYEEWLGWIEQHDSDTFDKLQNPINILIATDVLSEGQNLQDCDMVVNYDIHWNPVRIIQRMGRIDRLGSPNSEIFGINYWPSNNINNYLNLKGRIEERMAMMKIAGSEVHLEFSESFEEMAADAGFEDRMNERMLRQMETSWDDVEVNETGLGFDNLSLEDFRQDLFAELKENEKFYEKLPNGVYTGFNVDESNSDGNGIIALLGYPAKPPKMIDHEYKTYDLIYISNEGKQILINQKEVLDFLSENKEKERNIPEAIEKGEPSAISELTESFKKWLYLQSTEESIRTDGSIKKLAGLETKDILNKLKTGESGVFDKVKENISVGDKYQTHNFDLITWFLISNKGQ